MEKERLEKIVTDLKQKHISKMIYEIQVNNM